jgi:ADP-heptose:LPS heptosyltransferase
MKSRVFRIISWGGLGDGLLLTPSFKALKDTHPDCKVVVYCGHPRHMDLYVGNPHIDVLKLGRFHASPIDFVLFHLKWRKFYFMEYGALLPSLFYSKSAAEIMAEMLGIELKDTRLQVFLNKAEQATGRQLAASYENPIAINPTARSSKNHEWEIEQWEQVVKKLPNFTFVQLGLRDESYIHGTVDLRGQLGVREEMAFLQHVRCYAGVDSFLAHAAHAVGTPGVVLFGDSTPVIWGHPSHINIYKHLRCSPCLEVLQGHTCPYGKECMTRITVDEVVEAILTQVGAQRSRPPGEGAESAA